MGVCVVCVSAALRYANVSVCRCVVVCLIGLRLRIGSFCAIVKLGLARVLKKNQALLAQTDS